MSADHFNGLRAMRRHHLARLKNARRYYWGAGRYRGPEEARGLSERHLGMALHTPCPCSCHACGNSRKWLNERTVQERRELQEGIFQRLLDR